ncbi:glycosyltransferase family 4 protein [Anaerocolumna xylanovorans]|uniref:Glycosyltransferase involved in cell wall bisynthesis n=1 Tax=Anaerocolumna xylanovorans DSM 12503 TaxID=1121345 RepID=A0A1M7Y6F6_9FIRM|nr:glycosyltransferase family 1 protein [Anaerocolumna xylanovorans]SHO48233.1 Glycosyltransferase involved in cell wall bisynthesis [Anaerocolumna xylanovorans DSM 12503]
MKVALFTDTYLPQINGVTNTLNKLIQYYQRAGIEYKVFVPKYETEDDDCNTLRFYSIRFFLYPENRVAFPNTFRINSVLSDFQPDLIHIMTEFNMGLAGLNYGKKHGIPTISNYTTNFSQYMDYYKMPFLKQSVWNYMKWFHTQNDITLCPSFSAQKLLHTYGIHNTDIFSRGIDSDNFHAMYRSDSLREELGIADKTAFLYVGRVSHEKDLDILSESYQTIHEKYGDKVALVITGDGPYMEKCRQISPEDTVFTGFLKEKELSAMYASCDIFICPSSTETFGNVVLEAMSSGLPVIGADAGGVGEIVKHRQTGLKFAGRNAKELTACMAELLENPSLQNTLKRNGREYSTLRSWDKIFEGLMNIYEDTMAKKGISTVGA